VRQRSQLDPKYTPTLEKAGAKRTEFHHKPSEAELSPLPVASKNSASEATGIAVSVKQQASGSNIIVIDNITNSKEITFNVGTHAVQQAAPTVQKHKK
jgi:hypothetical protein